VKRNRKGAKRHEQTIQVWTYDQARGVLPYVASIMRSLREAKLDAQQQDIIVKKLADKPGRPNRDALIAQKEADNAMRRAEDSFQDSLEELHTLDVFCLDAIEGLALIPFAQEDKLAWFVFNLFEPANLKFWRYHEDPLETRRPIGEAPALSSGGDSLII
jgi:hypothetical protein